MKRILVVDESPAVRETLTLILGRDFTVFQKASLTRESLSDSEEIDLLILGSALHLGSESSDLGQIASRFSFPVIFLLESRFAAKEAAKGFDFLAKPFNPYELKDKVERLLTRARVRPNQPISSALNPKTFRYIEFPYLPASLSLLARRYALASLPLLMVGEAGCGQERIARTIHSLNEKAGPWVPVYAHAIRREYILGKISETAEKQAVQNLTLFLNGIETLTPSDQSSLLEFLEEEEERERRFWIISSSTKDLLEKVYQGEFLEPLYYRLGTLTLELPPLRERVVDIPYLAASLGEEYGGRLGLGKVSFSRAALDRLCHYLWFGNLKEMEAVIARTLAIHRKNVIEAGDLAMGAAEQISPPEAGELAPRLEEERAAPISLEEPADVSRARRNGHVPDIRVLINELAHELKNPMVTIKTYAQLLGERYDDAAFRIRFQETVSSDIERMDELVETLLTFSRFNHPASAKVHLHEQLRRVLEEILPECLKREATVRWVRKGENEEVFADAAQFRYAFKSVLQAILVQMRPQGEIEIDVEGEGRVAVSYVQEGRRMSPFAQYLDLHVSEEQNLPLRVLLAKILLERNGGGIRVNHVEGGKVVIRAELPVR